MIYPIDSTCALPGGWLRMYYVKDEQEAAQKANGRDAYLHRSRIIENQLYLFVPLDVLELREAEKNLSPSMIAAPRQAPEQTATTSRRERLAVSG